jgi:Gram-negative bacterial TonB protein C-terminal
MTMKTRQRTALLLALALFVFCSSVADAQTWQWDLTIRTPDRNPVIAQSRVSVSAHDLLMTYSVRIKNRYLPITTCTAGLNDIASAKSVINDGKQFFFVVMKPQRTAACESGNQSMAVVPIAADSAANNAVATVMRACCQGGVVAARSSPAPKSSATAAALSQRTPAPKPSASVIVAAHPTPAPERSVSVLVTPRPTATPVPRPSVAVAAVTIHPVDWVENAGLFSFVRIRNEDENRSLTIAAGSVTDCHDVKIGCARFIYRPQTLAPGDVMTLATVMSDNSGNAATFSYHYDVQSGGARYTQSGTSSKTTTDTSGLMSPQEVRTAMAGALGGRGGTVSRIALAPTFVAPKLIQRGSTSAGAGQRGLAVVRVVIGRDGLAQTATIVSINNRALVPAAIATAVSSTYTAAMRNGRPVIGDYVATFQFDGSDPAVSAIPVWRRGSTPLPIPSVTASPFVRPNVSPIPAPRADPSPSPSASESPDPTPSA